MLQWLQWSVSRWHQHEKKMQNASERRENKLCVIRIIVNDSNLHITLSSIRCLCQSRFINGPVHASNIQVDCQKEVVGSLDLINFGAKIYT